MVKNLSEMSINSFTPKIIKTRQIAVKLPQKTHDRLKKIQGKLISAQRKSFSNHEVVAFCIDYMDSILE